MTIEGWVQSLVSFSIKYNTWDEMDRVFLTNKVMGLIGLESFKEVPEEPFCLPIDAVNQLIQYAIDHGVITSDLHEQDVLLGQLMEIITPSPKVVNDQFFNTYNHSKTQATDDFFQLCQVNDYIKTQAIAKNIEFPHQTDYGTLQITINLSKPEKDPKAIQQAAKTKVSNFPACMLCMENEGYNGRIGYPNRLNHRIIRFDLNDEPWAFQYSPYAYFNEHSIIFSRIHRPMSINSDTLNRLVSVLDFLPHYFVGSNADLPIVGGSILSHDHYQAGRFTFPIESAPYDTCYKTKLYPNVTIGTIKWPMSVVRLKSQSKTQLLKVATQVLDFWKYYSDTKLEISAFSNDGTPHHTITPIARFKEGSYELDLVLRDNNTSTEHPDGIFHPHTQYHHIKKENIGLIEVMGLAILPPRLKSELDDVRAFLLDEPNNIQEYHKDWAKDLKANSDITSDNVYEVIQAGVGDVFLKVLENAGVYKRDTEGQAGFHRFMVELMETMN